MFWLCLPRKSVFGEFIGQQVRFESKRVGSLRIVIFQCGARSGQVITDLAHGFLVLSIQVAALQLLQAALSGGQQLLSILALLNGFFLTHPRRKLRRCLWSASLSNHDLPRLAIGLALTRVALVLL